MKNILSINPIKIKFESWLYKKGGDYMGSNLYLQKKQVSQKGRPKKIYRLRPDKELLNHVKEM